METKNTELSPAQVNAATINVVCSKAPVLAPIIEQVEQGKSLRELFNSFTQISEKHTKIYVNGGLVEDWDYVPVEDQTVNIVQTPAGVVETIVITAIVSAVVGAAIGYFLFKQDTPSVPEGEKIDRIRGSRNSNRAYEPIPVVLGKRKVTPNLAAEPVIEYRGREQYYRLLLNVGYGPLKISDIRIGDVPLSSFQEVEVGVLDWYENKDINSLRGIWNKSAVQVNLEQQYPANSDGNKQYITTTVPAGSGNVNIVTTWPGGLYGLHQEGGSRNRTDGIDVHIQRNGKWAAVCRYRDSVGHAAPGTIVRGNTGKYGYILATKFIDKGIAVAAAQEIPPTFILDEDLSSKYVLIDYEGLFAWHRSKYYGTKRLRDEFPNFSSQMFWKANKNEWIHTFTIPKRWAPDNQQLTIRVGATHSEKQQKDSWDGRGAYAKTLLNISRDQPLQLDDYLADIGSPEGNYRPVIVALRIRSSSQLTGTLDNVNLIAESVYPTQTHAEGDWGLWYTSNYQLAPSKNPADAYRWLLQGPMNPTTIRNSRIDLDALAAWRSRCVAEGWEISEYMNYASQFKDALNKVALTGRAEFAMRNGRFSVVEFIEKTIPTQMFTPKNSRDFTSKRNFPPPYEGVSYEFQNEREGYELDEGEIIDPQGVPNRQFKKLEFWGVTNPDLVQRHALFALLEEKARREVYTLTTDIESLACNRGDLVKVANDVIDVGIGQGFIKAVGSGEFFLDETKDLVSGQSYGVQVRSVNNGVSFNTFVATYQGNQRWTTSAANLTNVKRGDLAVYGVVGQEVLNCIVTSIQYRNDYEANITLTNAANEIFSIENPNNFDYPPYTTNVTPRPENQLPPTPVLTVGAGTARYAGPSVVAQVSSPNDKMNNVSYYKLQYRAFAPQVEGDDNFDPESESPDIELEDQDWTDAGVSQADDGRFDVPLPNGLGVQYYFRAKAFGMGNLSSNWSEEVMLDINDDPVADVVDFTITEELDQPRSPNGMWNTFTVEVIPPEDDNYLYSIVEYRASPDQQFQFISKVGWEFENKASTFVLANGQEYEIRVRSVSSWGIENTNGVSKIYTSTNTLDPEYQDKDPFDLLPVPNITGLELFDQGNDTEFVGRDAKFVWRKSSVNDWVNLGAEELRGANASRLDQYFRDYQVEIWADNRIVRTENVLDNLYEYSYEKNVEDYERIYGVFGAWREFQIRVYQRGRNNQMSELPAILDVENPAPEVPSGIVVIPGFRTITLRYNRPNDLDFRGVEVWVGTETGFQIDDDVLVYDGPDTEVVISGLETDTTHYIILRPYDDFGKTDIFSTEVSTTTLKIETGDLDQTPPDQVANLALSTNVYDSRLQSVSYIDASWDAVTNTRAANYTVEVNGEVFVTVASTGFRFTDAIPGQNYEFRVRANSVSGVEGPYSDPSDIDAAISSLAPTIITNASARGGLDKSIVEWTNPDSENFYTVNVHRGTTAGFTPNDTNRIASVGGSQGRSQTFIDSDVINGTTYFYKLVPETLGGVLGAIVDAGSATPFNISSGNIANYMDELAIGNAYINTLDAAKITTGFLDADRIQANTIEADKLDVTELSAITANMGTLTAGEIQVGTVNTGVNISTINGITAANGGTQTLHFRQDGTGYIGASEDISWDGNGNVSISGTLDANSIFVDQQIKSVNGGVEVVVGPKDFGVDGVYLLSGTNSVGDLQFGIDELGNAFFRGDISASDITGSVITGSSLVLPNLTIDDQGNLDSEGTFRFGGETSEYVEFDGTNLIIDSENLSVDGLGNATFSGDLNAASGTFSGELLAATGLFGDEPSGEYIKYENGVFEVGPNATIGSNEDRVVTVGTGGDFSTLGLALEYLSRTVPAYKSGGLNAEVLLLTGTVLSEQLIISGIDLSWIKITSQDTTVQVDGTGLTTDPDTGKKPLFACRSGGITPIINISVSLLAPLSDSVFCSSVSANSSLTCGDITASGFDTAFFGDRGGKISAGDIIIGGSLVEPIRLDNLSVMNVGSINAEGHQGTLMIINSTVNCYGDLNARYCTSSNYSINSQQGSTINVGGNLRVEGTSSAYSRGLVIGQSSRVVVLGNLVANWVSTFSAVQITSGSQLFVSGSSSISDSLQRGVSCGSGARAIFSSQVTCERSGSFGFDVSDGASVTLAAFAANYIRNGGNDSIRVTSAEFTANNRLYASTSNGVGVRVVSGGVCKISILKTGSTNVTKNTFNAAGIIWAA